MSETILRGVVGSTAYGLAREGSDIDHLGIFVVPTERLFSITAPPAETVTNSGPEGDDHTEHEVGKFVRLALQCNPTILELLWLPEDLIEVQTEWGAGLRDLAPAFLSEKRVRDAFGGYAKQQVERLQRRNHEGKEGFSSDLAKRTAKHARHCFRLLRQGRDLLESGQLNVRVSDPEVYWAFDYASVDEIVERFEIEDKLFRETESHLPATPDIDAVEDFLLDLRRAYYFR